MDRESSFIKLDEETPRRRNNRRDEESDSSSHYSEKSRLIEDDPLLGDDEKEKQGAPNEVKDEAKARRKAIINNIIAGSLIIALNVLYIMSLGSCPYSYDDPNICIAYFRGMYPVWMGETIIVGLMWTTVTIMVIYNYIPKPWFILLAINLAALFFLKSGMEMQDHGGINRTVLVVTILVLFLVYSSINGLRKLWKFSKIAFIGLFLSIFLATFTFYEVRVRGSCGQWEYGLGGHKIINDESQCHIPIPTLCELGTRNNWFDFSKFTNPCNKKKTFMNPAMLPDNLKDRQNLKRVGFPRVESFPEQIKLNQTLYRPYVRERIVDMDDPKVSQEIKDNIEYVIDISDPENHKLDIDLKPNATRAAEQQTLRDQIIEQEKLQGNFANRIDKNMLILYVDNLSRAHFYRKMPETAKWLEQFVDNQEGDYSAYQYFRYHSVYYNTLYSNDAMYFGEVEDVDDTSGNVFDSYARNGYVTGFFKDSCETNSNSIHDTDPHMHKWDHFGGEISCDSNYDDADFTSLSVFSGKGSAIRHCLYGQNMHNIQIDYLKQFWKGYPDNRKIFRTHFSEAHELVGELVKYIDTDIRDLLEFFRTEGYLEDTFVSIVSDHGAHALTLRFPAFPDNSRYIENYYPILFHLTKNDLPPNVAHYLEANEQSFIGSHDFYSSLKSFAENKRSTSKNAESYPYMMEGMPSGHDCSDSSVYTAD